MALDPWLSRQDIDKILKVADISPIKEVISDGNPNPGCIADKKFTLCGRPLLENFFNEHIVDIIENIEKYKSVGIDFPSAVILYGPPGCGKTFAVERLVEFIDWPSYSINSNSVGSPYIHETSKKISNVFDKAIENAPSVIIIDEMESFLSDRQSSGTTGIYHIEEVAEFLRRIPEALEHHVLVFAMTNLIDIIDPAILRRGRFDHIIEVPMPSTEDIGALIKKLLDPLPKYQNLELDDLCNKLAGKSLADVAFIVREIGRNTIKKGKDKIDQECIDDIAINISNKNKTKKTIGFYS